MQIRKCRQYDIVVCGAGPAGFCAAVAAARSGARTALVEKYCIPGGCLTVMGNNSIDEFVNPHREGNHMVIQGIAWEFVQRLHRMGYATVPDMDAPFHMHQQYGVKVNPVAAAKLMDDMLLESEVSLYYGQSVADVETTPCGERNRIDAVLVSSKSGLIRLEAGYFIDATGDGDLCVWAGNPSEIGGEEGELQPGTLRFYLEKSNSPEAAERENLVLKKRLEEKSIYPDFMFGGFGCLEPNRGDNVNHVFNLNSADSDNRTRAEIQARRDTLQVMDILREKGEGMQILATAPEIAARESRRILCDGYMTAEDYLSCRIAEDAVCHTYWFIDIHSHGDFYGGHVYMTKPETPSVSLSCMIPRRLTNVLVAGRCISGDRDVISAIRVKASCMAIGQAAGTAAAIAFGSGCREIRQANPQKIRKALSESGAVVPGLDEPRPFIL